MVINSVISGSGGLTFSGSNGGGSLTLNGVNTYTGPTTILLGGVQFNSAASFGSGGDPIRFRNSSAGGSMIYTAAGTTTLPNPIEIGLRSTGISANNSGTLVLNGVISGNALTTTFSGAGLTLSGNGTIDLRAANTFTGSVGLFGGTLGIVDNNNFGDAANQLYLGSTSTPTLRFDAAGIDVSRTVVVGGSVNLNTNGFDCDDVRFLHGWFGFLQHHQNRCGDARPHRREHEPGHSSGLGRDAVGERHVGQFLTTRATVNNGGTLGGTGTLEQLRDRQRWWRRSPPARGQGH